MDKQQDILEGKYYILSSKIASYFIIELCFIFATIPVMLGLLFFEYRLENILLFTLIILPLGPAFSAIFSVVLKIQDKDYDSVFKYFCQKYISNFWDSIKLTFLYSVAIGICVVDVAYVQQTNVTFFSFFFVALILFLTVIYSIALPITVKFSFKTKDILKLSIFYILTDLKTTFKVCSYLILISAFFILISETATILLVVAFSIFILKELKPIFDDIELKFIRNEMN